MSSYPRDVSYDITPVKNSGKSKGHKGTAPSKTPSVPNLINPGTYTTPKGSVPQGTPKRDTFRSSGRSAPALGEGVQYVGAKNPGKSSISELPGQYTKMPKPGGR
jgi:hypothetical protein